MTWLLYPSIQSPVLPPSLTAETVMESKWHQPWSDPFQTIWKSWIRQAAIARITSGPITPPTGIPIPTWDKWGYQWQDPGHVRLDTRKGLPVVEQRALFFILDIFEINLYLRGWFNWLNEPVRKKPGLRADLQHYFEAPPRILPTPNVIVTMAATETNLDVFLGAINVYDGGGSTASNQGAKVSVTETSPDNSGGMSIRED